MNKLTKTIVVLASVIITPAILFFLTYVIFESGVVEYNAGLFRGEEFYVFGKRVDSSWFATFQILVWGSFIASIPLGVFIGFKLIKRPDNTSTPTEKTKNIIPILATVVILGTPFSGALGIFLLSEPQVPNMSIHKAALTGNIEIVKTHLEVGTDVNAKDDFGVTPLFKAAGSGNKEVVELLIASGADANAKHDESGMTPLHTATMDYHPEIIELLIAKGAIVNTKNVDGETPLDGAIRRKQTEIADLLRKHGGKSGAEDSIHVTAGTGNIEEVKQHLDVGVDVDSKNKAGMTPLFYAARSGHKEVAELLLAKGADVNAKVASGPNQGKTPLDAANETNHPEVADLLRKHGAKTGAELKAVESFHFAIEQGDIRVVRQHLADGVDVNKKRDDGGTPLHFAAINGRKEIVELLIDKGADVNAKDFEDETPLDRAKWGEPEIADLLRKHGAKTSDWLNADNSIHSAASAGHIEAVKQHLAAGVDVNVKDKRQGRAPLHFAAINGRKEIVELLIDKGADVNAKSDVNGGTPLHAAAFRGYKVIVELLISNGAHVSAQGNDGRTPLDLATQSKRNLEIANLLRKHGGKTRKEFKELEAAKESIHAAARYGKIETVKQHLDAGVDVNAGVHRTEQTPLYYAAQYGRKEVVELLIAKGADVNAKTKRGDTPLDVAIKFKHTETADLLRKHGGKTSEELK